MTYKGIAGYLCFLTLLLYGVFVFFYSDYSTRQRLQAMQRHAVVIETAGRRSMVVTPSDRHPAAPGHQRAGTGEVLVSGWYGKGRSVQDGPSA